jgi:hypothetical protein
VRRAIAIALASVAIASAAFGDVVPPEAVRAELPFLDAPDGSVRIDLAKPGAHALPLQIDIGSAESFATPVAARDLGISIRRDKQTPYRRSTRLDRDVELIVDTRRGDTSAAAGGEWAILGGRFLAAFVVEIDLPGRKVRFLDPDRYTVPDHSDAPDEQVLPVRLDGGCPVVEIEVGAAHVPAMLSTAAPGTLLLPGGWAADAGVATDPDATKSVQQPMPGAGKLQAATAPSIRIGRFEEKDVPILVAELGAQGAGPKSQAIVGLDLLDHYVLRIDYPRHRLWMSRPAAGGKAP